MTSAFQRNGIANPACKTAEANGCIVGRRAVDPRRICALHVFLDMVATVAW